MENPSLVPAGDDPASLDRWRPRALAAQAAASYAFNRPRRPEDDEDPLLNSGFLWKALGHCWKWATLAALLLAAGSVAGVLWFFEPVYEAAAWIQIEDKTPYVAYAPMYDAPDQEEQFVKTQMELLRGPLVVGPALSRPEIAQLPELREVASPLEWMKKRINVESVGHSALYVVSYRSQDPASAVQIVNALIEEYFDLRDQKEVTRMQRVMTLLEEEKIRRSSQIQDLREKVRDLTQELVGKDPFTGNPTDEAGFAAHPLNALHERLTDAEVNAKLLEVEVAALKETLRRGEVSVSNVVVEMALNESTEVQNLRAMIAEKRALLHQIENTAAGGRRDPSYLRVEREIQQYVKSLEESLEANRPQLKERMQAVAQMERQDELEQLEVKLESARLVHEALEERYAQELQKLERSGDRSLELEFARAELGREEKVFDTIADRVTALGTEMRAPGRVTLLQRATLPEAPVEQFPLKHLGLAVLASFVLPFGLGILRERVIRRISASEQLGGQLPVGIVAEVAQLPNRTARGRRRALRSEQGQTLFEESIDSLRTCLILADPPAQGKVLAITSAVSGEGKTSVASQLAVSLSRASGHRVLLIDGDMRSPDIHRLFQLPKTPGLAELLDRQCSFEEAVVREWSANLDLLPAGILHKTPHELLGMDAFQHVLEYARAAYGYIILDTPPILPASEALVLAKAADATLLCALRGRSRESQTRMAYERLAVAGARPIGAVLNAVPTRRYASTYGKYGYAYQPS